MKKLFKIALVSMLLMGFTACSSAVDDDLIVIGGIQFVEHPALDAATEGFKDGLKDAGYIDGENYNFVLKNAQGDMSNSETIATTFVNEGVDLIFANATPTAQAAANKTDSIPIIITAVTDPFEAGLVDSNEGPTNTNVTGTSDLTPVKQQADLIKGMFPEAKVIGILYTSSEENSLIQKDNATDIFEAAGYSVVTESISDTSVIKSVTDSIISKIDVLYIPTDNLLAENMPQVSQIAIDNQVPVFGGEPNQVESGALVTIGVNYYNLGFETGKMAALVLDGSDPSTLAINYLPIEECEIVINTTTAKALGYEISEEYQSQARLVE